MKKIGFLFAISFLFFLNGNAQDKIKLKSGEIIKSRVLSTSGSEITYYKIYKLKDPKLKLAKSEVEYIKYENGKIVYMSGKDPVAKTTTATSSTKKPTKKKKTTTKKK